MVTKSTSKSLATDFAPESMARQGRPRAGPGSGRSKTDLVPGDHVPIIGFSENGRPYLEGPATYLAAVPGVPDRGHVLFDGDVRPRERFVVEEWRDATVAVPILLALWRVLRRNVREDGATLPQADTDGRRK